MAGKPIKRFSEAWKKQKINLLGHLLRADPTDPLHQITFINPEKEPRPLTKVKHGAMPMHSRWIGETIEEAHAAILNDPTITFTWENPEHYHTVLDTAMQRQHIFETKLKQLDILNPFASPNIYLDTLNS